MTRLIDLMMRGGEERRKSVEHMPAFVIDNVHRYMSDSGTPLWTWEDFPNLAPPFGRFWMEYQTTNEKQEVRSGVGVYAASLPENRDEVLSEANDARNSDSENKYAEMLQSFIDENPNARWLLNFVLYDQRDRGGVQADTPVALVGRLQMLVDAQGQRASTQCLIEIFQDSFSKRLPFEVMFSAICPFLLGISFMHCRNVQKVERKVYRQEKRRVARGDDKPLVVYKTLVIEPMTRVLRTEGGQAAGTSLPKAMHICRGHFKTFDEKPLFGKHRGMFFWEDQVRAKRSKRAVAKRYDVHPARDESGVADSQSHPTGDRTDADI
jgi:hypothetical protein